MNIFLNNFRHWWQGQLYKKYLQDKILPIFNHHFQYHQQICFEEFLCELWSSVFLKYIYFYICMILKIMIKLRRILSWRYIMLLATIERCLLIYTHEWFWQKFIFPNLLKWWCTHRGMKGLFGTGNRIIFLHPISRKLETGNNGSKTLTHNASKCQFWQKILLKCCFLCKPQKIPILAENGPPLYLYPYSLYKETSSKQLKI